MSLLERLDHWAQKTPDNPALVFEGQTISFQQFRDNVRRTAAILHHQHSVTPGDRVAYLGINHPNVLYLVYACAHLGAIFAPFNSRLARDEYLYLTENADPIICFYDENFAQMITELGDAECPFVSASVLSEETTRADVPEHGDGNDDPLLLVYTSGTTGRPKGVLLSHRAVLATIENGHDFYDFAPDQNILITLPLFHVGGLCILLLPALFHGATVHLHARFDPDQTIKALEQDNITGSILVPAQMAAMMAHERWPESAFPSMRYLVVGSSIIPLAQIQEWHARGIPVSQIYGATETGPTAIGLPIDDAMSHEGSAGVPAKLCSIEVRDREGTALPSGENGEIWVKGPNILSGYWRNEEETALVLKADWYNTGDVGYRDDEGFYWIVDRSKDVIISGGENIYPAEVEAAALQHPAIQAIAVVGKPDPRWGETPVAVVELKPDQTLNQEQFRNFFQDKIARFKQPKEVLILDSLPRNSLGKIEKAAIRKMVG